jgi:hypothetical protein
MPELGIAMPKLGIRMSDLEITMRVAELGCTGVIIFDVPIRAFFSACQPVNINKLRFFITSPLPSPKREGQNGA